MSTNIAAFAAAEAVAAERVRYARLEAIATRHSLPPSALTQAVQTGEEPAAFAARVPDILAQADADAADRLAVEIAGHLPANARLEARATPTTVVGHAAGSGDADALAAEIATFAEAAA